MKPSPLILKRGKNMTDEQYKRYIEESYSPEEAHFLEDQYEEGLGQALKNGVQKVKNFFTSQKNNAQNKTNQQVANQADQTSTVANSAPTAEDNLRTSFLNMANEIIKVAGQLGKNSKAAYKQQYKDNKGNIQNNKKGTQPAQDQGTDDAQATEGGDQQQQQESQMINDFFSHLTEATFDVNTLQPLLQKHGLDTANDPNKIADYLMQLVEKNPDEAKNFVDTFYSGYKSKNSINVNQALDMYNKSKTSGDAQQQMLNDGQQQQAEEQPAQDQNDNGGDQQQVDNGGDDTQEQPAEGGEQQPEEQADQSQEQPAAEGGDQTQDQQQEQPAENGNGGSGSGSISQDQLDNMVGYFEKNGGWQADKHSNNIIVMQNALDAAGVELTEAQLVDMFFKKIK